MRDMFIHCPNKDCSQFGIKTHHYLRAKSTMETGPGHRYLIWYELPTLICANCLSELVQEVPKVDDIDMRPEYVKGPGEYQHDKPCCLAPCSDGSVNDVCEKREENNMTTVVHCKREQYDVYIGRGSRCGLPHSKWHNPYVIGKDGTRAEVIAKYRLYVLSRPELMASLHELKDKRLGCWCSPEACHGDVLVELIHEPILFYDTKGA